MPGKFKLKEVFGSPPPQPKPSHIVLSHLSVFDQEGNEVYRFDLPATAMFPGDNVGIDIPPLQLVEE